MVFFLELPNKTIMKPFLHSYTIGAEPRELVNTCLGQIGDIPTDISLGFIYVTDALARELEHILHLLQQATGIEHWAGSVGMAICVQGQEVYDQPAMAIMLTDFPLESFRVIPNLSATPTHFLKTNRSWIDSHQANFAIIHGDPNNPSTPTLMEDLANGLGEGFFVGGLTSSQAESLQITDGVESGGLSGVLFSSEVTVLAGHTQGCSPVGPIHNVTRSDRNVIEELDNRSALAILKEDAGEILARDLNRLSGYIFVGLPLAGSDTGDYMVRNLIGIDASQERIAIGEMVHANDRLMFCHRDGNTAREDMLRMLESLRDRCEGRAIRGAVYYSCMGRGREQFGVNSEELKLISETLGEFPLVGFYASGEFFHNRLYGFTGVLNLFL